MSGGEKESYRILVGKSLGRPSRRWGDNLKMYIGEIRWGGTYWIDLVQNKDQWRALVNAKINIRVP
jgi:hypothetical protein